jgi:hypothetical protein
VPHDLDLQLPIERLDLNSMIHHQFVSPRACLDNLSFEITFFKESVWKVVTTDRSVHLPAPLLFNLDRRNEWLMACKNSPLGTPRGRYDEHSSKSSLSCETKV